MSPSVKDSCKYFLVTATNLYQSHEISPLQYDLLKELIFSYDSDLYSSSHTRAHVHQYIVRYTKKLYDLLFLNLTLEHAHILATTYADEVAENLTIDTRALVYGEIEFDSFIEVLNVATDGLQTFHKFIDLGHGIGRALIVVSTPHAIPPINESQAALMCNFEEYHGIEILKGLYEVTLYPCLYNLEQTSLSVAKKFSKSISPLLKSPPSIQLAHGSFLAEPHCSSWLDADLIFANSTCFPDELIADIAAKCALLKVGARVITFTTSLRSEYFKVLL